MARDWLISLERPNNISDHEYNLVLRYAAGFFKDSRVLWKHDPQGAYQRVLYAEQCIAAMVAVHNDAGHCRYYASHALIMERYWWPFMGRDIAWYVRTCHIQWVKKLSQCLAVLQRLK